MNLLPTPKRRTLAQSLRLGLVKALTCSALVAAPVVGGSLLPVDPASPESLHSSEPTKVERLIERNACWTGEAPAAMQGKVPGHVVVSLPDGRGPRLGGPALVGKALDNLFAGADHDLTVHAFCR